MKDAESWLRHRVLVGTVAQGRAGLGSSKTIYYDKDQGKDRRSLIHEEVQAVVEEEPARWWECGSREPGRGGSKR